MVLPHSFLTLKEITDFKENKKPNQKLTQLPTRYYISREYPDIYLTQREIEIAALLVQGKRYRTIGEELSISSRSVEQRVKNLKAKFKCTHKNALAAIFKTFPIFQS